MKRLSNTIVGLLALLMVGVLALVLMLSSGERPQASQPASTPARVPTQAQPITVPEQPSTSPPTPQSTAVPPVPEASAVAPSSLESLPPGLKIVYSEFQPDKITVWAASVSDPTKRHALFSVERHWGAGIRASLSHDQKQIAYTAHSAEGGDGRYAAELWVTDVDNPQQRKLASQVDSGRYMNYPLWSPDNRWIVFDRKTALEPPYEQTIAFVDIQTGQETILVKASIADLEEEIINSIYPLDWSPDGRYFYYKKGYSGHVELWRVDVTQGNSTEYVGVITEDGLPRCYFFSPGGQRLLCTILRRDSAQNTVVLVPVGFGQVETLITGISEYAADPFWDSSGQGVTLSLPSKANQRAEIRMIGLDKRLAQTFALPIQGDVAPRSWSPDGQWLAMYRGAEADGDLLLVSRDAMQVHNLSPAGGLEVIGWITR